MLIQIVSKKDGFRRCGIPHPSSPTTYPDDRFTPKELKILKAETMLVVIKVEEKAVKEKKVKKDDNKGKDSDPEKKDDGKEKDSETSETVDYSTMTYNELRTLAKKKGLKASGSKKNLIKRLK